MRVEGEKGGKIREREREREMLGKKKNGIMCGMDTVESEIERVSRDDDKSSHSISTGILPSLGAHSNRRIKLRPFIVSPFDPHYRFMTLFLFF